MKINHTITFQTVKVPYIERFNRTIQTLIAKEAAAAGDNINVHWFKYLDRCLFKYNNVNRHSFTKMTPAEGEREENQAKLALAFTAKHNKIKRERPKFRVGDYVRIWNYKGKFGRGYQADFSNELFVINKVLTNLRIPRYELTDLTGQVILGNFKNNELRLFIPPPPPPSD